MATVRLPQRCLHAVLAHPIASAAVDLPSVLPMLMDWSQEFQIDTFGYEYPG